MTRHLFSKILRRDLRAAVLAAAVASCASVAAADDLDDWLSGPYMTGDWGGLRSQWAAEGITPRASIIAEMAGNASGGRRVKGKPGYGTRYDQNIEFGADFNLERLAGWNATNVHVTFVDRVGRGLSQDVIGNKFSVNGKYSQGEVLRISEIDFDKTFSDLLFVKGGFFPIGNDFATSPFYCNFEALAMCSKLQSISSDSGWENYPRGNWAGLVKVTPVRQFYVQAGISSVNPTYTAGSSPNGLKMDFSGATGAIMPVEVGWVHGRGPGDLPGDVKVGAYWDDSPAKDVLHPTLNHYGRYGGYLSFDQMVYRESPLALRGLNLFGSITQGDRPTAPISMATALGAVYQGPIRGRDADTVNFVWTRYYLSDRSLFKLGAAGRNFQNYEEEFELNYGIQLVPWAVLRPGFQYVVHPGAFTMTAASQAWKDAFVYETQLKLTF